VAVVSLYYSIQTSVNLNQPEKFAISTNQKCFEKVSLFVFAQKRCQRHLQCKRLWKFAGLFVLTSTLFERLGVQSHEDHHISTSRPKTEDKYFTQPK